MEVEGESGPDPAVCIEILPLQGRVRFSFRRRRNKDELIRKLKSEDKKSPDFRPLR